MLSACLPTRFPLRTLSADDARVVVMTCRLWSVSSKSIRLVNCVRRTTLIRRRLYISRYFEYVAVQREMDSLQMGHICLLFSSRNTVWYGNGILELNVPLDTV